jgi:hypothetical protein
VNHTAEFVLSVNPAALAAEALVRGLGGAVSVDPRGGHSLEGQPLAVRAVITHI